MGLELLVFVGIFLQVYILFRICNIAMDIKHELKCVKIVAIETKLSLEHVKIIKEKEYNEFNEYRRR